jgi:alkylation response protein AidB-like acyl-CoA dehydrogenase
VHDRHAFGRSIATFQVIKHRMADLVLWLESAKATVDAAATALDEGAEDTAVLVSTAKAFVGEKSGLLIQECIQLHGGIGMTWEHDLHLFLRRATVNRAVLGTPEDHRARICRLLGI